MNLKTALFIALFFSAIALSHQATADNEQVNVEANDNGNLLDQAKATERRAVTELKRQANNAKEQFKAAFNKLKASRATSQEEKEDTSDSDSLIQKAITEAETAADQVKQGEWRGVSELKAQAQRAKEAYKTAKASLKSRFSKAKSSDSSSDSSDSSDDVRDATEGVVDKAARAAEWKIIAELKEQYNNAKRAAKVAFKKLRKQEDSSSSSDSSDGTVKETIKDEVKDRVEERVTEAVHETVQEGKEGLLEQARNAQRAAYQELKDGAQRAKDAFWNAYKDLKNKIRTEKGQEQQEQQQVEEASTSSSSSSSSDSSDSSDDSILKKARRYSEILRNRAEQVKNDALNRIDDLRHREHVDNDL